MDISIIIGLLIALMIVCATTLLNNVICNNYRSLKSKWEHRTKTLSDLIYNVGRLEDNITILAQSNKIDEKSKQSLMEILSAISSFKINIHNYEYEDF